MRKGPGTPRGGRGKGGDGNRDRPARGRSRGKEGDDARRARDDEPSPGRPKPDDAGQRTHDRARAGKDPSGRGGEQRHKSGAAGGRGKHQRPSDSRRSGSAPRGRAGTRSGGSRAGRPPADQRGEELRIQVYLARAGVASRRASDELVRDGRVRINDHVAELGQKVIVGEDRVTVDEAPVRVQPFEWVILHKPRGYVTTREDPENRRTIYDLLPDELRHLFHVGRLDRDSTGIILLTNEGETANRLLHPRYGTTKEYVADVTGRPDDDALEMLVRGVELEDGPAQAVEVEYLSDKDEGGASIRIVLEEGRNREVRRMLEAIGCPVRSLYRRRFGPLTVGRLRRGEWRRLTGAEVERLREYTT